MAAAAATEEEGAEGGWLDPVLCEHLLTKEVKLSIFVDGSPASMSALAYVTESVLQRDRSTFAEVVHIFDPAKTYLPPNCRSEAVQSVCEARLAGSVPAKRCRLKWIRKEPKTSTSDLICKALQGLPADFAIMGFIGLKGKKDQVDFMGMKLSSNVSQVLNQGNSCSLMCIRDEEESMLPIRQRKCIFVVSAGLNKSSTKAFLDALRLSRPGDELHVVYVKGYMENEDSDYTAAVREKFESLFKAFQDDQERVWSKYNDRVAKFSVLAKDRRESIAQAVVGYADSVEADFLVVGANAADRVSRGKAPVGSVSLQMCLLWDRNFVVANWIDLAPEVYKTHVRGGKK